MSGFELKAARRLAGIRQKDLAEAMGIDQQRVSLIEKTPKPHSPTVDRYLIALATVSNQPRST